VGAVESAVFAYLRLLREGGVPQYVFDECRTLADIAWKFQVRPRTSLTLGPQGISTVRYPRERQSQSCLLG
jgi:secreted Zn-dependent insulinase-like peptidase